MSKNDGQLKNGSDGGAHFLCFVFFSTIGMACVGMVLIATPLHQYYTDQVFIGEQQGRLEELRELAGEQGELLENTDSPLVWERAAIRYLNYLPADLDQGAMVPLEESWPGLEEALAGIEQKPRADVEIPWYRAAAEILVEHRDKQMLLALLGGVLVLVSLVCFSRQRMG